jgi:hypothetical protein
MMERFGLVVGVHRVQFVRAAPGLCVSNGHPAGVHGESLNRTEHDRYPARIPVTYAARTAGLLLEK